MTKKELRAQKKARRDALPAAARAEKSAAICERLLASPEYRAAEQILAYAAIQSEVDLRAFCRRALADGKALFFPRVEEKEIAFYQVSDFSELTAGTFLVPEPDGKSASFSRSPGGERAWLLAPGVAFSTEGARLGYGGGFYDRFLAAHPVHATGIAFELQMTAEPFFEPHDRFVDVVMTEQNRYRKGKEHAGIDGIM